jgi:hypothetical protein
MLKKFKPLYFLFILIIPLFFSSLSYGIPPKPGPQFVWVEPHTTESGTFIRGHWKYIGPPKANEVWIMGHYNDEGKWVIGHWKLLSHPRPHKGAIWVPGHRGPKGRWVPGHWR